MGAMNYPGAIRALGVQVAPARRNRRMAAIGAVLLSVAVTLAGCGSSSTHEARGIIVTDARIPAPATKDVAAVYLTITNTDKSDDVLESVTTSAGGDAEVHRSMVEHGTSTMKPAGHLTVKAGAALEFAPGGYHVMIMNPTKSLSKGDRVKVTLKFRHTGPVVTEATVLDAAAAFTGSSGSESPGRDTSLPGGGHDGNDH